MLKRLEFNDIFLNPLAVFYESPTEDQADTLFQLFKDRAPDVLVRAVEIIRQEYPYKTFPNPFHIHQAMDQAQGEYSYLIREITKEDCDKCYGMGIKLVEKFDEFYGENKYFAVPCDCSSGAKRKKAWGDHYKKHRYYRVKAGITEIAEEDPY